MALKQCPNVAFTVIIVAIESCIFNRQKEQVQNRLKKCQVLFQSKKDSEKFVEELIPLFNLMWFMQLLHNLYTPPVLLTI